MNSDSNGEKCNSKIQATFLRSAGVVRMLATTHHTDAYDQTGFASGIGDVPHNVNVIVRPVILKLRKE